MIINAKRTATLLLSLSFLLTAACTRTDDVNVDHYGRRELVLASYTNLAKLNRMVADFNNNSEDYYITIDVYETYGDDPQENMEAFKRFSTAVMSPNTSRYPDIVVSNTSSYPMFAQQRTLADLGPYLDADENHDPAAMFEGVLNALYVDDRLYGVVADFIPHILVMNDAAATLGLSLETVTALQSQADYPVSGIYDRWNNLGFWLLAYLNEFIDWEAGTCDFSDPRFMALVEMTLAYPSSFDPDSLAEAAKDGRPIYMNIELRSLYQLQAIINLFGGEFSVSGFPGNEEEINILSSGIYSITAHSRQKDAAWAFISGCLSDEYQATHAALWYFDLPVSRKAFEDLVERQSEEELIDGRARIWESVTIGPDSYEMTFLHADTVAAYRRILDMDMNMPIVSQAAIQIIFEEVYEYYDGKRSMEQMIHNIENRVGLYLKEIM